MLKPKKLEALNPKKLKIDTEDRPRSLQDHPGDPQRSPKTLPRQPKIGQDLSKTTQEPSQDRPKFLRDRPRPLQDHPRSAESPTDNARTDIKPLDQQNCMFRDELRVPCWGQVMMQERCRKPDRKLMQEPIWKSRAYGPPLPPMLVYLSASLKT